MEIFQMKKTIDSKIDTLVIEYNGKEYPLVPKTVKNADAVIAWSKIKKKMPEYEQYLSYLKIVLGEKAVAEIFPAKDEINITLLRRFFLASVELYADALPENAKAE